MSLKDIIKRIYVNSKKDYISSLDGSNQWFLTSYISDPFYKVDDMKYMKSHQNRHETLIMNKVINDLGYNNLVVRYDKTNFNISHKISSVKFLFGLEPNFINLSSIFPDSVKIYYATGAYFKHQNEIIKKRTDEVNRRRNTNIAYNRLVHEHQSSEIADYIVQIGSKYTIETYPSELRNKIIRIRQTTYDFKNVNLEVKKSRYSKNDYLWFGSKGAVLKGLDLLLDFFSQNEDLNLHIVGPIERDFIKSYNEELFNKQNIRYYGYLDIDSKELYDIAEKSTFVILPSGSEGGMPGSVLNMMKLGLIPIVTCYAAFDEIKQYGILIDSVDSEGVSLAIKSSQDISDNEIEERFSLNRQYILKNYNKTNFENDFRNAILYIKNNVEK